MSDELARELEQAVVDSWPATETRELDGWLLRASGGPTQRGNSVATLAAGSEPLAWRIRETESWYAARHKRALIQVGPCARPAALDAELEARGYALESPSLAACAASSQVLSRCHSALTTRVESTPASSWLAVAGHASRFAATYDVFLGFLARLHGRIRCASVLIDGRVVATALGILCGSRLGIYAMFTLPDARGRGAGSACLGALAACAVQESRAELYLLVDEKNLVARRLYARAGFSDVYPYHYRLQPG